MKTFCKSLMLIAAAAIAFVSCQKEMENQEIENGLKMKTIKVSTDIATRTTLDSNHENIVWSTGDEISLFNDVNNDNAKLSYSPGGYLEVEVPETTTEIYTHYPYYNGNENGPTSVSVYIAANQTQVSPGQLAGKYFPMVAKGTVSEDNKAIVSFYPVAGALALNIYHTGLSGEETVQSVTVTPTENTSFVGSQVVNLTADKIVYSTPTGNNTSVKVSLTNGLQLSNTAPTDKQKFEGQVYVCLAKQSYKSVKFTIVTNKGTYEITSSATNAFDLVNNDFIPVNINLAKASFTEFTLTDGDYVVLSHDSNNSKYYAMSTDPNGTSSRRDLEELTYDGSGSVSTNNPKLLWTISKNNSTYSFFAPGVGQYLNSGDKIAPLSSESSSLSITSGITDGTAVVTSGSGYLKRNSTYGFGFYSSSEDLYLIPVTYTGNPLLSVSTEDLTIAASDTGNKELAVNAYLYTTISVAVYSDQGCTSESDLFNVSYDNGIVYYSAKTQNTSTTEDNVAYIRITATNSNGSTNSYPIKLTQSHTYGTASDGDVLWGESFTGFATNAVPTSSNSNTTVYGNGELIYNCINGGSDTKVYNGALAGGTPPELLISKTNGSFTASGIPSGAASVMTLSYASNNTYITVSSTTNGIELTSVADGVYKIDADSGISSFDLVFTNSSSSNSRIDDIFVVVGAPVARIEVSTSDATDTETAGGTTATLNGSISLVNGASIEDVTEAGFYYKLSTAEDFTKVVVSPVNTTLTYSLTGLTSSSEYKYYAYAIYSNTTVSGEEKVFAPVASSMVQQTPVTFDLTTSSYSSSTDQVVTWTATDVTMKLEKSSSSTNANNYLGGTGTYNHTRLYKDQVLSFTPAQNCQITSIEITTPGSGYANTYASSTWTNASASTSGSKVTVIPSNGSSVVSCTISAATRATSIVINYKK